MHTLTDSHSQLQPCSRINNLTQVQFLQCHPHVSLSFSGEAGTWKGFNSIQRVPSKHSGDNVLTQQRKCTLKENTGLYTSVSVLPGPLLSKLKKKWTNKQKKPTMNKQRNYVPAELLWNPCTFMLARMGGSMQEEKRPTMVLSSVWLWLASSSMESCQWLSSPTSIFAENTATFSNESRSIPYQQITTFFPPNLAWTESRNVLPILDFFFFFERCNMWFIYSGHLLEKSCPFFALSANGLPSAETV